MSSRHIFFATIRRHAPSYVLGIAAMMLTSAAEVAIPKWIQWTLDAVMLPPGDGRSERLTQLGLGLVATLMVGFVGRIGWRQILARRTHVAGWDLKVRMWERLRFQPLRFLHQYTLGDLMSRATGDWSASRTIFGFSIVLALDIIFFVVFAVAAMLSIDVTLTCVSILVFPLLAPTINRLARKEEALHQDAQKSLGVLSDHVAQTLAAVRLTRATGSGDALRGRLNLEAREYAERRLAVVKTGWKIFPLGAAPTLFAYLILLTWGLAKVEAGTLSIGAFVALQSYVLILQSPLFELGECIAEWQKGWASLNRIAEILSLESSPRFAPSVGVGGAKGSPMVPTDGVSTRPLLDVRSLTYSYPDLQGKETYPALKKVSFAVGPRETIGIYGPIGSGKSTLLGLIAGLIECPPGSIFLGGVDVGHLPRDWFTKHVSVVPQKAFLFAGSIRQNLLLDGAFSDDQLWDVLSVVGLADTVRGMPQGLSTWIGEWGITLSGGQRQRMALARALLRPRSLLLMDDALSAVDTVTEEQILRALKERLGASATIWVAHRASTLKLCDRLYVMDDGHLEPVTRGPSESEVPRGHPWPEPGRSLS